MCRLIKKTKMSEFEFIALMAFLMANVALAIDAILPGLTNIGVSLNVAEGSDIQGVITMIFLGIGVGELIFGTLSDSFGRKPMVYLGVGLFVIASIISATATSIETMLFGRVLQGIGLSAPRTVSMAIIRDSYQGNQMARIMSFISAIFILVPMVAPMIGQLILNTLNWQAIFYFQILFILITIFWFKYRQEETLIKEKRTRLSRKLFTNGFKEFVKHKQTLIYTIMAGLMEGIFILYLSTSKQIFQDQYHLIKEFPYVFAALSFVFGISTFLNGRFVVKYGMHNLVTISLYLFSLTSLIYLFAFYNSENPSITILMLFLFFQFLFLGFIFGNLSALAMQPIGHIAGIGAAIFSFVSMALGVFIANLIGEFILTTVHPLFYAFFATGLVALILLNIIIFGKQKLEKFQLLD
ncbi:multidrug effflux MFS transporter [Flavivirga sp. Y03]|uniref:Multidrug effflux MFS transporter n=2 Tax=Flavivirga algicola TaxID=2729136 RepID=A0ABX1RX34_9FLAO|nr:multidrug effflux MFS transporter [Flavivirga algicola]